MLLLAIQKDDNHSNEAAERGRKKLRRRCASQLKKNYFVQSIIVRSEIRANSRVLLVTRGIPNDMA